MGKKSMGAFLVELRKEKELTQQQVAEALNVSNKTISKWERDEGYPEITMLTEISRFYEITTDELLEGCRNDEKNLPEGIVFYEPEVNPKWALLDKYSIIAKTLSVCSFGLLIIFCLIISATTLGVNGVQIPLGVSTLSFAYMVYVILEKNKYKQEITLKSYNNLFFSFFFFGITLFTIISFGVSENYGWLISPLPLIVSGVFFSIITTYLSYSLLNKILKFSVITKEKRKVKRLFTYLSAIFTSIAVVVVILLSIYEVKTIKPIEHKVEFLKMYDTYESAVYDYQRLKELIFENGRLYELVEDEGNILQLTEIVFFVEDGENGYKKSMRDRIETHLVFEGEKHKADFIELHIVETGKLDFLEQMDENIVFDDENFAIEFSETEKLLDMAKRTSVYYSIIAMGVSSVLYSILSLVYYKKEE